MKEKRLNLKDMTTPFFNGFTDNNPVFRLILGTCPTLAITTSALNGIAMGLCTTFVMVMSNCISSMLRKIVPPKVRIPCYITIVATFVTIIQMFMNFALPELYQSMGIFLPLITVNCIVFSRVESFATLNPVLPSIFDGLGVGLGYTVSLLFIGSIREFLGAGSVFGIAIPSLENLAMTIFIMPTGGFLVYGFLMVIYNKLYLFGQEKQRALKKKRREKKCHTH